MLLTLVLRVSGGNLPRMAARLSLFLVGILLSVANGYSLADSFRTNTTLTRGGTRVKRYRRPGLFWFNVSVLAVLGVVGIVMIVWAAVWSFSR
jgi:hypothetical protein